MAERKVLQHEIRSSADRGIFSLRRIHLPNVYLERLFQDC